MHESKPPSDALVFFGATGDLAYKKIFPALQSLTRRGRLNVPVIGVAFSGWNRDQLIARAKASCTEYGGLDPAAFEKLSANLRYVDGDYKDPKTFERLKGEPGKAKRPTQYLAIPPSMFTTVVEGLAKAGAAEDARVVVEKPFGRSGQAPLGVRRLSRINYLGSRAFRAAGSGRRKPADPPGPLMPL